MNIQIFLENKINVAMAAAGIIPSQDMVIRQSNKKQFGDYQANGVMAAAKKLNCNPRQLANTLVNHLDLDDAIEKVEVAGAGFINFYLNQAWLVKQGNAAIADDKLGVSVTSSPQTIVVDYSAPNIAKEMHVGHLRSTIIGDVAVKVLTFLGHRVIKANHIGDWGTQFGMLIAHLEKIQRDTPHTMQLADLEQFYQEAKQCYDTDSHFAQKARRYVVKLQNGDAYCATLWRQLVDMTMTQNIALYKRLNVSLTAADIMGESAYNSMLPDIVSDLKKKGLAVKDNGATVVYLDEFKNKEGQPMGVIIQKSDGGYLYSTTDIACVSYRYNVLHADRILYYTDSRQHQHLQQVWAIARKAGYIPDSLKLEHHMFGLMLDANGKPFKTRSGGTVKLNELLNEAEKRAEQLICQKKTDIDKKSLSALVDAVAIGAIKYADLSKNRTTDYIFDWDKMLAFEGNTAPYLQYAYTRMMSIFKKAHVTDGAGSIHITENEERSLLVRLLQFDEAIQTVANQGLPHVLCSYLYDIAVLFSSFYENCSILNAQTMTLRQSRLKLVLLTARTLKIGLDILGIKTVDKM